MASPFGLPRIHRVSLRDVWSPGSPDLSILVALLEEVPPLLIEHRLRPEIVCKRSFEGEGFNPSADYALVDCSMKPLHVARVRMLIGNTVGEPVLVSIPVGNSSQQGVLPIPGAGSIPVYVYGIQPITQPPPPCVIIVVQNPSDPNSNSIGELRASTADLGN